MINYPGAEENLLAALQAVQAAQPAVQIIILTIDGKKFACIGPVMHLPTIGLNIGEVTEIEFGEVIPARLAAQLLDGSFLTGVTQ